MFKLLNKAKKNEKGFTLVELMVVIVIIGILVAIAIPIYGGIQRTAAESAHDANVRTLQGAGNIYFAEDPVTAQTVDDAEDLVAAGYLDEPAPEVPEMIRPDVGGVSSYSVTITEQGAVSVTPGIGAYDS